jgi:hypothetical protein
MPMQLKPCKLQTQEQAPKHDSAQNHCIRNSALRNENASPGKGTPVPALPPRTQLPVSLSRARTQAWLSQEPKKRRAKSRASLLCRSVSDAEKIVWTRGENNLWMWHRCHRATVKPRENPMRRD